MNTLTATAATYDGVPALPASAIHEETRWRKPKVLAERQRVEGDFVISRWLFWSPQASEHQVEMSSNYHTIGIALRPARLMLEVEGKLVHHGRVLPGMVHVNGPEGLVRARFETPCDFLHLHVAGDFLRECMEHTGTAGRIDAHAFAHPDFNQDPVVERLTQALVASEDADTCGCELLAEGISTAIVSRLLRVRARTAGTPKARQGLAYWRLKRSIEFIEANLDTTITLAALAEAAGLSRMHFASEFRAATGQRPHEYVLRRRIERAQDLLASSSLPLVEIALECGFQTQAHFTTVFKRIVNETPRRWREFQRAHRVTDRRTGLKGALTLAFEDDRESTTA